ARGARGAASAACGGRGGVGGAAATGRGGEDEPGYADRVRGGARPGAWGRRGRAAEPEAQLPLQLWQRATARARPRHLAAGADRAAAPAARPLHRAALGQPVHRAAGAEPPLLAVSDASRGTATA